MPALDFSDALLEPSFEDGFRVIRRPEVIDAEGYSTIPAPVKQKVSGIVNIAGANDLQRLPEEQHASKTISIVTQFRLRTAGRDPDGTGYQADIVQWGGDQFVVLALEDYSHFGRGYIRALCGSIDSIDIAPQEE